MSLVNPSFEEFKGYTHKQKTINKIYDYIREDRIKQKGFMDKYIPLSVCTAFNPDTEEITDVGCSVPNDIINDNFGEFFSKLFTNTTDQIVNLLELGTGLSKIVRTYGPFTIGVNSPYNNPISGAKLMQSLIQVGIGVTLPTRADIDIETPFATGGPEDIIQTTNPGSHIVSNNTVQIGKIITPTNANGTVKETILAVTYQSQGNVNSQFLFSRDLVTINFLTGQSISVSYIWNY